MPSVYVWKFLCYHSLYGFVVGTRMVLQALLGVSNPGYREYTIYAYTHMCTCTYKHAHIHILMCAYTYTQTHTCVYTRVCILQSIVTSNRQFIVGICSVTDSFTTLRCNIYSTILVSLSSYHGAQHIYQCRRYVR